MGDGKKVVIHYHRFDKDYEQAGLWTWDGRGERDPDMQEVLYSGETDFGVYFVLDPSGYGNDDSDSDRIGFIARLRRDWNQKDGGDRYWTPAMGKEIWLIGNQPQIYTERPDISPKIAGAYIDGHNLLTIRLSHPMPVTNVHSEAFIVKHSDGGIIPLKAASPQNPNPDNTTHFVSVVTEFDLDFQDSTYEVSTLNYRPATAKPRNVMFDAKYFSMDGQMGAVYTPESTTFRIFSPLAKSISVVLYDEPLGQAGRREIPMAPVEKGGWQVDVPGDLEGKFYRLRVATDRYGDMEVNDPYARNTTGHDGHARITDVRAQDPEGFRPVKRPEWGSKWTDAVIYEVHIRDMSIDHLSGATPVNRGKYLGLTERGTHHPDDPTIKTLIDHFVELGITHVQILPPQDFDNDETKDIYNWGYMTSFFDSPEGWFASDIRNASRVNEFKRMVQALHEAGIAVIMDVVYNHTGTQNTFDRVAPGYFLRMRDDGSFWNGSGTGNEFRSEAPMGRKFIIDSCKYWMEEYGVDGFRFDLMGLVDIKTMQELHAELKKVYPNVMVYGEPWAATGPDGTGIDQITYKEVVRGSGVAAFNDHFRNNLKGEPDGDKPGYVQDGSLRDGVKNGIAGSIDDWANHPWEAINYATCHDNLTLWDKFLVSAKGLTDSDYRRMQKLTGGILAVSQGVLFYHGGADFSRTKNGEHNSYNAGDEVNMINWTRKQAYFDVFEFHQGAIAIRRAHPMFRLETASEVRARLHFIEGDLPAPEAIVFTLKGDGLEGETWKQAACFINPTARDLTFKNPFQGKVAVHIHDGRASATALDNHEGDVVVPARSMTLLAH